MKIRNCVDCNTAMEVPLNSGKKWCKDCLIAHNKRRQLELYYYQKEQGKRKEYNKTQRQKLNSLKSVLKIRYGISLEQFDELFEKQQGCCAVCHRHQNEFKKRLAVDHDHKTGEIRGLLCDNCNRRVIGHWREPERFLSAANYLTGPFTSWFIPKQKKKKSKNFNIENEPNVFEITDDNS